MTTNTDWIEWAGGECPVPGDTLVQVQYRDGKGRDWPELAASFWSAKAPWNDSWVGTSCGNQPSSADIIAYRIVKP